MLPPVGATPCGEHRAAYERSRQRCERSPNARGGHTNRFDYAAEGSAERGLRASPRQSVRFETRHPLVRVHPETGERALLLGGFAQRIVGMGAKDSAALLLLFQEHVERHENMVRWRWRLGDVAFWDNRTTQHRAIADFGDSPRRLHRVTIAGDLPYCVSGQASQPLTGDSSRYTPAAA